MCLDSAPGGMFYSLQHSNNICYLLIVFIINKKDPRLAKLREQIWNCMITFCDSVYYYYIFWKFETSTSVSLSGRSCFGDFLIHMDFCTPCLVCQAVTIQEEKFMFFLWDQNFF